MCGVPLLLVTLPTRGIIHAADLSCCQCRGSIKIQVWIKWWHHQILRAIPPVHLFPSLTLVAVTFRWAIGSSCSFSFRLSLSYCALLRLSPACAVSVSKDTTRTITVTSPVEVHGCLWSTSELTSLLSLIPSHTSEPWISQTFLALHSWVNKFFSEKLYLLCTFLHCFSKS